MAVVCGPGKQMPEKSVQKSEFKQSIIGRKSLRGDLDPVGVWERCRLSVGHNRLDQLN